ncbi:MAG: hypothetical protein KGO05_03500, partial [Chloroflexota bacterium]|nr:hypothetical protein [Chloroflexota bacterium]
MTRRRGAGGDDGSERLFRALLWLYPPSLRRAYGAEMARLFREMLRDEVARAGPPGTLRAWSGALADLAATIPREWPDELARMRRQRRIQARRRVIASRAHVVLSGMVNYGPTGGVRQRMSNDKFDKFT